MVARVPTCFQPGPGTLELRLLSLLIREYVESARSGEDRLHRDVAMHPLFNEAEAAMPPPDRFGTVEPKSFQLRIKTKNRRQICCVHRTPFYQITPHLIHWIDNRY